MVPGVVELHDDEEWLWWNWDTPKEVTKPRKVLAGFLELADARPQEIRDYARRWGVLGICRHGLPYTHNLDQRPPGFRPNTATASVILSLCAAHHGLLKRPSMQKFLQEARTALVAHERELSPCTPLGFYPDDDPPKHFPSAAHCWEPIELWNHFARHARALLTIADSLKCGTLPLAEHWEVAFSRSGNTAPWWERTVDGERLTLARVLNEWLALGAVRPTVGWHGLKADIAFVGPQLFSMLAQQLVYSVSGGEGVATCSGCGKIYAPTRHPKHGQRNYCPRCRDRRVPQLHAQRAHRRGESTPRRKKTEDRL